MNAKPERHRRVAVLSATAAGVLTAAQLAAVPAAPALAATTAAVYAVTQEGLTWADAQQLASTFGIANTLQVNGALDFVSPNFATTPSTVVGQGVDESGRPTTEEGLDLVAAAAIRPITDTDAIARAQRLVDLAGLSEAMRADPVVSHTQLTVADGSGQVQLDQPLDTAVIYRLSLNGLPLTGSGARLRVTFAPDGTATQLSHALRRVQRVSDATIISVTEATQACAALYQGSPQDLPTLGYQCPELTSTNASGQGTVRQILPQYTCNPQTTGVVLPQVLLPAIAGSGPRASFAVSLTRPAVGGPALQVQGSVSGVTGGTAPYSFRWTSSSTQLPDQEATLPSLLFTRTPRNNELTAAEQVTLQITDANGLTATAFVSLPANGGTVTGVTSPGGGGFTTFSVSRLDAGTETPAAGECNAAANASADGFRSELASHAVPIQFDWRGNNAWEADFKDPSRSGGDDSHWIDDVDIAWLTGHGDPNGFIFNTNHTDTFLGPADTRWGNGDLEWLQLQVCNLLQDVTGTNDYFRRWGPSFAGLHMLNGYDSLSGCVKAGIGGAFAKLLFPAWWGGPLTVRRAWAAAVIARDPGRKYRSMGPLGPPINILGLTLYPNNINDYFWGQGSTGPDYLPWNGWMWSITGTS
jgi:hypothetical protein